MNITARGKQTHILVISLYRCSHDRHKRLCRQGRSQGGPGVPVTAPPPCKPFCKQTTYNIQVTIWWVPSVWPSVIPPLKTPGHALGRCHEIASVTDQALNLTMANENSSLSFCLVSQQLNFGKYEDCQLLKWDRESISSIGIFVNSIQLK